jgi:phosphohistidine phosphatase SixA
LLFRHGATDMSQTDQEGYLENLENCDLQRNLSPVGIKQLEFISSAVKLLGIPLDTSLTSPMCRTRETGRIITGSYKTSIAWMGADSNYTGERFADLGRFTKDGYNSVISTHMNSIEDVTTVGRIEVQEGDAIIIKPLGGNVFEEIGHITTDTWEKIINYLPANTTDVSDPLVEISGFYLSDNYPNPFNPVTTIEYKVPFGSQVSLKVFDALGREVKSLVNEFKSPGNYKVLLNASDISSGVYFYTLNAGEFSQTKKLMILK